MYELMLQHLNVIFQYVINCRIYKCTIYCDTQMEYMFSLV